MKNKYLNKFKYKIHYLAYGEVKSLGFEKTLFKAFLRIRKLKQKGHKFVSMEEIE